MTLSLPHGGRRWRRLAVVLAVLGLTLLLGAPAGAGPRSPRSDNQEYLVVADPQAKALHVYRASDNKRTGSLHDIVVSTHGGTLPLPDGRLIVVDDGNARVVAISISSRGKPRIVKSVAIPVSRWRGMAWGAADPNLRHFAFSTQPEDNPSPILVVDLHTFEIKRHDYQVAYDSQNNLAEPQVYLIGDPVWIVFLSRDFSSMPLSRFLETEYVPGCAIYRRACEPSTTGGSGAGHGAHGPVVARDGSAVFSTTAEGFVGAFFDQQSNIPLTGPRGVRYSPDSRDIPHSFHPRLAPDERMVWGAVTENPAVRVEQWARARNNVSIIDSVSFDARLVRVPDGRVSKLAISSKYAAVSTIHPEGDALTLLDADRGSDTFGRIVGTVAIPSSTDGPVVGHSIVGTQPHVVTLDPDGKRAYITNGGDGTITVVDTELRRVIGTIRTPTPLNDGGYLVVVKRGAPVHDLIPR